MDGKSRDVYNIETPRHNVVTCWIASESGKKFSVNWRNTTRRFALQGAVTIDGVVCDTHIMLDASSYPNRPNAVGVSYARTSDFTRRDFMFTAIEVTDDDAYLHTVGQAYNFGTITLELWRLQVTNVVSQQMEHQAGSPVLEGQVVHEKTKKAGTHHVKYGEEYYAPAPVIDVVSGYKIDAEPWITFIFKYRPIPMLMANGIIPRPVASASNGDQEVVAEIRTLEAKLQALRSRVGHTSTRVPTTHSNRRIKAEPRDSLRGLRSSPVEIIDLTGD